MSERTDEILPEILPESLGVAPPETRQLEAILNALTESRSVRTELVDEIRGQLADDRYMSREKLDLAIFRLLKDALR
jgi:hypothetical protein